MRIVRHATSPLLAVILGVTGGLLTWTGYSHARHDPPPARPVTPSSLSAAPLTNHRDTAHQTANELGRIPIIEYHSVGDRGAYDANGLNLAPSVFRAQLEALHKNGFYPVNLRDILDPAFTIPAGKSPVVITFDDARQSQMRYRHGTVDPTCAVGILDDMHRRYGNDWPQRATFFVLPGGWSPQEKSKLNYLVTAGYEIANHSTTHHAMRTMDDKRLTWESENCKSYIQKLAPGATMDTFALPYGIYPSSKTGRTALMKAGNRCLVKAWGDASLSPLDKRFDIENVDRIVPSPGHVERWITILAHPRVAHLARYVSDGDPTTVSIPPSHKKWLASTLPTGQRLVLSTEPTLVGGKTRLTNKTNKPSRRNSPRRLSQVKAPTVSHATGIIPASTTVPAASDKDAARRR